MTNPWTPWHKVVTVRDDVQSGDLSLSLFAADLYDVAMQQGRRPIYEQPDQFFALTYPTYNLRELAKDVVTRLAGRSDKAVRQLELTYGGGKTHTLITLYHLVNDPSRLPDLPAVHEFTSHIGMAPPPARVAALTFDKLDVEKGLQTRAPNGETRWLRHPWSVLAFQLAGAEGLRILHADGQEQERESAPAENLLTDLLARPQQEGLATLILIDEVLMYAHEKVGLDPAWRGRLTNWFQYLTQAVSRVDRCALVASLLASDTRKNDPFGRELAQEFFAIFRREREEGVQPVVKDDVAEVLRRRFFTPDSIRDREAFRSHVTAALHGIVALDDQTRKARPDAEERYVKSYPFHPDLTEVFYTKWTNLESFQRTRGILRTFALAIREAAQWDDGPLIGANVFLSAPGIPNLSDAARELTGTAASEEYDGKRHEWASIIEGELTKARQIQQDMTGSGHREIEQAVMAVFLHSQPVGQRAQTRDLLLLLGATRPDLINLSKALRQWVAVSWFLDDETTQEMPASEDALPRSWRLGPDPNLTQMHHDACSRVASSAIEHMLREQISKLKWLSEGATAAGARVHTLPREPGDVDDTGEFRYVILGASAAAESGKPSTEARRFLETASGGTPRIYRNAMVLSVPSHAGLEAVRTAIRTYLGWEDVQNQVKGQELDSRRERTLRESLERSRRVIPEQLRHAYGIIVTMSEKNDAQAFKLTLNNDPLFLQIKADKRARIQDTPVTADALLPGGPYTIWHEDDSSRRVKDLVSAFAQFPHLPKMLNSRAILDTLRDGCQTGLFVMRLARPDQSVRMFWHTRITEQEANDAAMEVLLPDQTILTELSPTLLAPDVLPGLWETPERTFQQVCAYFAGGTVVSVDMGNGYAEPLPIPTVERATLEATVRAAVEQGLLWLIAGHASFIHESVPEGIVTDAAVLQAPPAPVPATDILPPNLPEAWGTGDPEQAVVTAQAIADALSSRAGKPLPWHMVANALRGAFQARFLERTEDSGPWPCDTAGARMVRVRLPVFQYTQTPPPAPSPTGVREVRRPGVRSAESVLQPNELQDLIEKVGDLMNTTTAYGIQFTLRVDVGTENPATDEVVAAVNALLRDVHAALELGEG
jgi:hypothetical protein